MEIARARVHGDHPLPGETGAQEPLRHRLVAQDLALACLQDLVQIPGMVHVAMTDQDDVRGEPLRLQPLSARASRSPCGQVRVDEKARVLRLNSEPSGSQPLDGDHPFAPSRSAARSLWGNVTPVQSSFQKRSFRSKGK